MQLFCFTVQLLLKTSVPFCVAFSDTTCCVFFSTPQPILQHQVSVQQFSLILILTPEVRQDPTGLRAPFHKIAPTSDASLEWGLQETHISAGLTTNSGVATTTFSDTYLCVPVYYKVYNSGIAKWRCVGQGMEWRLVDEQLLRSLASRCSPTWKLPKSKLFESFYRTQFLATCSPQRQWRQGWEGCKLQTSNLMFDLLIDWPSS